MATLLGGLRPKDPAFDMEHVIVVKVGSSTIIDRDTNGASYRRLSALVSTLAGLKKQGWGIVVVTSAAVGLGCLRTKLPRPAAGMVAAKQALAAIGQVHVIAVWDALFAEHDIFVGQVLVGRSDIGDKLRYENADRTLKELLRIGAVPIVNENDTLAVVQHNVGDNDTLSALVSTMVRAQYLFLLTDVDGLYTCHPADPKAKAIHLVEHIEELQADTASGAGGLGTGGMGTKITAAQIATAAGTRTIIINGETPQLIGGFVNREDGIVGKIGTEFAPRTRPTKDTKRWILAVQPRGDLLIDEGAVKAIKNFKSLFAAGVRGLSSGAQFDADSAVRLVDKTTGVEVARAIINYSAENVQSVIGKNSTQMQEILGDQFTSEELCFRTNIVVVI